MSKVSLRTSLISTTSELEALREPWAELLSESVTNEVMQGPIWLINWWHVYGQVQGRELCTIAMHEGDRLVGLAAMCRRKVGKLGLQHVEFMGSGEDEEHETCSEYIGLLAAQGYEQRVADAFGDALENDRIAPWDELDFTAMSSEAVISPLLARAMGKATVYEVTGGAPFVTLPSSWDEYLASLPSSRRYLVRRSLKDWEKWAGEAPTLRRVEHEDELDEAFEMLATLHEERWQEVGHDGAFASPLFRTFHKETMRDLFRVGALWLNWLEVEGKPVAATYSIIWNNQIRFYQSGRKLDLPKKIRAGLVIHVCAIRESIEAGYSHYDFLAGTTRYKMQLADNVRPLMRLSLSRPSLRSKVQKLSLAGVGLGRLVRNEVRNRFPKS